MQLGHFFVDFVEAFLGVLFGFVFELAGGELELHQAALHLVDLGGDAFEFHGEPAGGFVHQVDRLVGQEAVADVAVRELGGGNEGGVLDLHALVMGFVARLEAAEDGDRVFDVRLADEDGLEAALEGGVFFDVLAIFVERGGADAAELAAGEGRLEEVGRIGAAFGCAGADHGVQLVDEQDHVAGVLDFFQEGLEAFFELAAELRAGDQRAHVERDHARFLRLCGTSPWTMRRARPSAIAVLPTPGSPMSTGLFFVRRERTWITRRISWSRPITGSSLPWRARSTRSMPYFSRAWNLPSGAWSVTRAEPRTARSEPEDCVLGDRVEREHVLGFRLRASEGEQQVLGGDELVLHAVGFGLGGVEDFLQRGTRARLGSAARLRQMLELRLDDLVELVDVGADFFEHRPDDARCLRRQRREQMHRLDLRIPSVGGEFLRATTASWALMVSLSKRNAMIESFLAKLLLLTSNGRNGLAVAAIRLTFEPTACL